MSASSEDGDVDGAAERELEYQRLQKKYRTMENDRQKYSTESQEFIRKQRYLLHIYNINCIMNVFSNTVILRICIVIYIYSYSLCIFLLVYGTLNKVS